MTRITENDGGRRRSSSKQKLSRGLRRPSAGLQGKYSRSKFKLPHVPALAMCSRFFKRFMVGVVNSKLLLSIPFAAMLLLSSIDSYVLTHFTDSYSILFFTELGGRLEIAERDEAELMKANLARYIYLFILCLCALKWRVVHSYFMRYPHIVLLFAVLALSSFVSIYPTKVFTNTILAIIGFLTAILFAIANRKNLDALFLAVIIPMVIIHFASLGIFTLYDVNLLEFLDSKQRYGGLAGNPNSLGATAVLGYWSALSLVLSRTRSALLRNFALLSIPLFGMHIMMSGSGTAVVAVTMITALLLWLKLLAAFSIRARYLLNFAAVPTFLAGLLAVSVFSTPADLYLSFTDSLGKDSTLTGRTELWALAREAISLKPVFGWGFDSHLSVKDNIQFDIRFNHYHNGFLDTLIAGGFVLMAIVLYNLSKFAFAFLTAFRKNENYFPMIVPLAMLLMLNLSEYSLLRPNSAIWQIYVVTFVLITFSKEDLQAGERKARSSHNSKRRSKKRRLSW